MNTHDIKKTYKCYFSNLHQYFFFVDVFFEAIPFFELALSIFETSPKTNTIDKTQCVQPTLLCFLLMYIGRIQKEARHLPKILTFKLGTQKGNINKVTLDFNTKPQATAYRSYTQNLEHIN